MSVKIDNCIFYLSSYVHLLDKDVQDSFEFFRDVMQSNTLSERGFNVKSIEIRLEMMINDIESIESNCLSNWFATYLSLITESYIDDDDDDDMSDSQNVQSEDYNHVFNTPPTVEEETMTIDVFHIEVEKLCKKLLAESLEPSDSYYNTVHDIEESNYLKECVKNYDFCIHLITKFVSQIDQIGCLIAAYRILHLAQKRLDWNVDVEKLISILESITNIIKEWFMTINLEDFGVTETRDVENMDTEEDDSGYVSLDESLTNELDIHPHDINFRTLQPVSDV
jgi:hypothetical protein